MAGDISMRLGEVGRGTSRPRRWIKVLDTASDEIMFKHLYFI